MGEAIVCSPLAWTLLFTLQKVMYLRIRWHSTADEELLSWKWLPNRTNKTLQNAQHKGLDSLPQASLWGACFISHFPSKETKALASLMKCLTDRESEHRQSRTPASPSPPPLPPKQPATHEYMQEFPDASKIPEPVWGWIVLSILSLSNAHHNRKYF